MYVLEIGPEHYVGGPMTASGYGATRIKALAVSFETLENAAKWCAKHEVDAAIINCETDVCVF